MLALDKNLKLLGVQIVPEEEIDVHTRAFRLGTSRLYTLEMNRPTP